MSEHKQKPEIEIKPRWLFLKERNEDLILAIARHIEIQKEKELMCRKDVNPAWINELVDNYNELFKKPIALQIERGLSVDEISEIVDAFKIAKP